MGSSVLAAAVYGLAGAILGGACGWLLQSRIGQRRLDDVTAAASKKHDEVTAQRDLFADNYSKAREKIKSLRKKTKLLARNVVTLRTERENTKLKLSTLQNALGALRNQTTALQSEFEKTQNFYKRELTKSFDKRKQLEKEVQDARSEQESFDKLVESAKLEHGSTQNMIVAAQLRFGQLQVLERNINKLEAENAELNRDLVQTRQELDAHKRDLAELEKLKIHNKQLVHCVEALEGSRKEYETEAEHYRQQADESEKLSDTLRLKLDDLEKNFADMEKQQDQALEKARKAAVVPILRNQR